MDEREKKLKLIEDHIGRSLAQSEKSGELRQARDWGKPEQPGFVRLAFAPDAAHRAVLELQPTSVNNPFHSRALKDFEYPK